MVAILIVFWSRWGWLMAHACFLVVMPLRWRGINKRSKYQKIGREKGEGQHRPGHFIQNGASSIPGRAASIYDGSLVVQGGAIKKMSVLKLICPRAKTRAQGTSEIELALVKPLGISKKICLLDVTAPSHELRGAGLTTIHVGEHVV
jgi:hypothetical protein